MKKVVERSVKLYFLPLNPKPWKDAYASMTRPGVTAVTPVVTWIRSYNELLDDIYKK